MSNIPGGLATESLIIRAARLDDLEVLQDICETWDDKILVEGEAFPQDYILRCLTEGDLPPISDASKEKYRMMAITLKETGETIGLYDLYFGYPNETSVWTSIFLLHKAHRHKGYGQEILDCIAETARTAGYTRSAVGVQLKNWPALRFWTRGGYTQVLGVFGDTEYSPTTYAVIGLEKVL